VQRLRNRKEALQAIRTLLAYIGEDPERPGLLGTPERVVSAWENDWGSGYDPEFKDEQASSIAGGMFHGEAQNYNQVILVRKMHFVSHCEHHMAPFFGTIDIAYVPREGNILGLSKFARIVDLVSRKLQVQERLTTEVASMVKQATNSNDVAVLVRAIHMCMISRGVRQPESETITSALFGEFYDSPETRNEFLRLVELK